MSSSVKINPLTTVEENLMNIIWTLDSPMLKEILEAHPEPKPHQNTVSTYTKILVEKKFLTTEKIGRIFKYHIQISLDDYKNFVLNQFIENYFEGSAVKLLDKLYEQKLISTDDKKADNNIKSSEISDEKLEEEISKFVKNITSTNDVKSKKKKKKKKKKKSKKKD